MLNLPPLFPVQLIHRQGGPCLPHGLHVGKEELDEWQLLPEPGAEPEERMERLTERMDEDDSCFSSRRSRTKFWLFGQIGTTVVEKKTKQGMLKGKTRIARYLNSTMDEVSDPEMWIVYTISHRIRTVMSWWRKQNNPVDQRDIDRCFIKQFYDFRFQILNEGRFAATTEPAIYTIRMDDHGCVSWSHLNQEHRQRDECWALEHLISSSQQHKNSWIFYWNSITLNAGTAYTCGTDVKKWRGHFPVAL